MGRDNHNAGMHFVYPYEDYGDTRYYDGIERKKRKQARDKQYAEESISKQFFDMELEKIQSFGDDVVDIFLNNVAFFAYSENKYLRKVIADINQFITTYPAENNGSNQLSGTLFYLGLLANKFQKSVPEFFVDRRGEIKQFFEKEAIRMLDDSDSICRVQPKGRENITCLSFECQSEDIYPCCLSIYKTVSELGTSNGNIAIRVSFDYRKDDQDYIRKYSSINYVPTVFILYYEKNIQLYAQYDKRLSEKKSLQISKSSK